MAQSQVLTDHNQIRKWVEERSGKPAKVKGAGDTSEGEGLLRVDFGRPEETLETIDWDEFFEIFEKHSLGFLCETESDSRFFKFVNRSN